MYLERDYSWEELLYIASKSKLYIGCDLGITQLLQAPTNAFIFFANTSPWVWKPYSNNSYTLQKMGRINMEETTTSKGVKKVVNHVILKDDLRRKKEVRELLGLLH